MRILGSWTANRSFQRAFYQCKYLSQQLWPTGEPIFPQFSLGYNYKMAWNDQTLPHPLWAHSEHSCTHQRCLTLLTQNSSQNLSANSAGWQKWLSNLLACSEAIIRKPGHKGLWDRRKRSKVTSGCVRWQKNTHLSLSFSLSLSHTDTHHITVTISCGTSWNINKSFINLRLKYSQLKFIFRLPWTPARMKQARIRHCNKCW